jgi:hypothetical protein
MLLLNNLVIADTGQRVNISIDGERISAITPSENEGVTGDDVQFDNAIVFPGLINSHDHLDFNLFPQLGAIIYKNYSEWGKHLHENYKEEINTILKVPKSLREQWGMYKNLLCGVTTVLNHGKEEGIKDKFISIYENKHDLHSVGFDKQWRLRLNNLFKRKLPVVIHAGEGTDRAAKKEIDSLLKWNLLNRNLIAVHGVAMHPDQARDFKALVWCPESNYYLLNKTAPVNELKLDTKILFGTDSTLTGRWNIWDHIRLARKTTMLHDEELYYTLNQNPANIWRENTGQLVAGKDADIVIAKMKEQDSFDSFFATNPADILLVVHKGNIRLIDATLYPQIKKNLKHDNYSFLKIGDSYKYVEGDLTGLTTSIKQYCPQASFPFEMVTKVPDYTVAAE